MSDESIDYQHVGGYGPESLPGHSGSETSYEAARGFGVGERTKRIHQLVIRAGAKGVTMRELGDEFGISHGSASGALSRLHRAGLVHRLMERRGTHQVYVDSRFLEGRQESPYKPNAVHRNYAQRNRTEDQKAFDDGNLIPFMRDMVEAGVPIKYATQMSVVTRKYV